MVMLADVRTALDLLDWLYCAKLHANNNKKRADFDTTIHLLLLSLDCGGSVRFSYTIMEKMCYVP